MAVELAFRSTTVLADVDAWRGRSTLDCGGSLKGGVTVPTVRVVGFDAINRRVSSSLACSICTRDDQAQGLRVQQVKHTHWLVESMQRGSFLDWRFVYATWRPFRSANFGPVRLAPPNKCFRFS